MTNFDKTVQLMQLKTLSPSDFRKSKLRWTIGESCDVVDDKVVWHLDNCRIATGSLSYAGPWVVLTEFPDKRLEMILVSEENDVRGVKFITYYLRAPRNFDKMNARLAPLGRELGKMLADDLADLEDED